MITAYNRITKKYESVDPLDARKSYNKYAITFDRDGRPLYNGDRVERWYWDIKDGGWVLRGHQNIYFNDYWWVSSPNVMYVLVGRNVDYVDGKKVD